MTVISSKLFTPTLKGVISIRLQIDYSPFRAGVQNGLSFHSNFFKVIYPDLKGVISIRLQIDYSPFRAGVRNGLNFRK